MDMTNYIKINKKDDITIVTILFSEISIEEAEEFRATLYKILSDEHKKFIINMSKCVFLPSVALGVLVRFNAKVVEKSGRMVFCCLSDQVKSLFEITRLDKIFTIYNTEQEAIDSLK